MAEGAQRRRRRGEDRVGPPGERLALAASPRPAWRARRWDAAAGGRGPGTRGRRRRTVALGGSIPSAVASSPIDIGRRASRRIARVRPKLMPTRVGDLAPALVVEHEVGHQQPDLARGVAAGSFIRRPGYATSASGLSARPCARADAPARVAVATSPRQSTSAPQAASVHQAGWLAGRRGARGPPPATRRSRRRRRRRASGRPAARSWRCAAATPAWARGIPETAAFVIGALTNPKPRPKMT